jgi:hypothetical protein
MAEAADVPPVVLTTTGEPHQRLEGSADARYGPEGETDCAGSLVAAGQAERPSARPSTFETPSAVDAPSAGEPLADPSPSEEPVPSDSHADTAVAGPEVDAPSSPPCPKESDQGALLAGEEHNDAGQGPRYESSKARTWNEATAAAEADPAVALSLDLSLSNETTTAAQAEPAAALSLDPSLSNPAVLNLNQD